MEHPEPRVESDGQARDPGLSLKDGIGIVEHCVRGLPADRGELVNGEERVPTARHPSSTRSASGQVRQPPSFASLGYVAPRRRSRKVGRRVTQSGRV